MIDFLMASAAVVVASDLMGGCFGIAVIQAGFGIERGNRTGVFPALWKVCLFQLLSISGSSFLFNCDSSELYQEYFLVLSEQIIICFDCFNTPCLQKDKSYIWKMMKVFFKWRHLFLPYSALTKKSVRINHFSFLLNIFKESSWNKIWTE